MMDNDFQLFLCTVDEYKRFANHLPVSKRTGLSDNYTEADYVGIQVRLMLLRKYYGSSSKEKVNFKRLLSEAEATFPNKLNEWKELATEFSKIESQQAEHVLSDGTKLKLYETIEDTVYGLYLHADENRVDRLEKTAESIRFFCTRKYIIEIEDLILRFYDLLVECGVKPHVPPKANHSPVVYLGDPIQNTQSITASPYWSNLYGHDATNEEIKQNEKDIDPKEKEILLLCLNFTKELSKTPINKRKLRKFIHPAARSGWGNFQMAQEYYNSIPNPGFSTKIRYNDNKDTAYVRILPNVDGAFIISTPHVLCEGCEIALGKCFGKWKIYQLGGHLDSIFVTKNK